MKCLFDFLGRNKPKKVKGSEVFSRNNYYYVKSSSGSYEMIYRAVMGVCWDEETLSLYFKGLTSRENALKIISEAVQNEYDIELLF